MKTRWIVNVKVDRPMGSKHPRYPKMVYPVNYGYVEGVLAADGMAQDAYVLGVDAPVECFTGAVVAVIRRMDDIEDKWVVAPPDYTLTAEQIRAQTNFQEKYFNTKIQMLE